MNFVFVTIKWSVNMGVAGVIVKCKIPTVRNKTSVGGEIEFIVSPKPTQTTTNTSAFYFVNKSLSTAGISEENVQG